MKRKYTGIIPAALITAFMVTFLLIGCKQATLATTTAATTASTTVETTAATTAATSAETTAVTSETTTSTETETTITQEQQQVIYKNTQYGFNFPLPISWEGYSIIVTQWEGYTPGTQGDATVEKGPIISIRHPEWTSANPRQDIPIMVFTLAQWNTLQQGKFFIGAGPEGPSELGRNTRYVFGLPFRYNYSFPTGYEEVEKILEGNPLQTF